MATTFRFGALLLSLVLAPASFGQQAACVNGSAAGFPCENVDMLSRVGLGAMSSSFANDLWGWTDPETGNEYALVGLLEGTAFVDISNPTAPVYLGRLPSHTGTSLWRDIKTHANHAYIVS